MRVSRKIASNSECVACLFKTGPGADRKQIGGFTLVELLTIAGVLGILFTLLASTIANAKTKTQQAVCGGNLHQIAIGIQKYSAETGKRPRSFTRLADEVHPLLDPPTLLCPSDPALRRVRQADGSERTTWGNSANQSQEPGLSPMHGEPESGSWQAELVEKQESVPFSYLHPLGWPRAEWQHLTEAGELYGVTVCQLHGVRVPYGATRIDHRKYMEYEGRLLRATADGGVVRRKIFREDPNASSGATTATAGPPGYPWDFYLDHQPLPGN
jgi:type II secretory pathway pseudopilin PulG